MRAVRCGTVRCAMAAVVRRAVRWCSCMRCFVVWSAGCGAVRWQWFGCMRCCAGRWGVRVSWRRYLCGPFPGQRLLSSGRGGRQECKSSLGRTWTGRAVGRRGHVPEPSEVTEHTIPNVAKDGENVHELLGTKDEARTGRERRIPSLLELHTLCSDSAPVGEGTCTNSGRCGAVKIVPDRSHGSPPTDS